MNIQQLEYVLAVHRFKHFGKAANYCHVTQATLSAMIKKLEEELEVNFFDRKASPIVTTDCGLDLIESARKVLYEIDQLKEIAKTVKNKVEGHIKIGIIPTIANVLMPKLLKKVLFKYPRLNVEILEITTQDIVKQLKEGSLDVGLLSTPLRMDEIEENILYYEALMVYGELENEKQYVVPGELYDHKIWLLEEGNCLRDQVIEICKLKQSNALPENLKFEANSFETLLNLVDEFGGLTLIPELYDQTLSEERHKRVRKFQVPIPVREISMVYFRPFAKFRLIHLLTEEIKQLVAPMLMTNQYKKSELTIVEM